MRGVGALGLRMRIPSNDVKGTAAGHMAPGPSEGGPMPTDPRRSRIVTYSLKEDGGTAERCSVAIGQYQIRASQSVESICAQMDLIVRPAAAEGAILCLLPELIALDAMSAALTPAQEKVAAHEIPKTVTPKIVAHGAELAKELDIAVLVSAPRHGDKGVYNTAHLLMPDGTRILQNKIFLTRWERDVGWTAGSKLHVWNAPWGRSAILTCYDIEFPELSQALANTSVEVILTPSMTESEQGAHRVRDAACTRASEHCAYVMVGCTTGRPAPDWEHFGQGAVVSSQEGPFFGLIGEAPKDGPGLVVAELDLGKLRDTRQSVSHFPIHDEDLRQRSIEVVEGGS